MSIRRATLAITCAILSGCTAPRTGVPAPLPTVQLDGNAPASTRTAVSPAPAGGITASGYVVAATETHISSPTSERISEISVRIGDKVTPGQVLLVLDDALARAQVSQAQAGVAQAQAALDGLTLTPAGPAMRQADAVVEAASVAFSRTLSGGRSSDVVAAQSAVYAAVTSFQKLKSGPNPDDLALVRANFLSSLAALKKAQAAYDTAFSANQAGIGATPASLALEQATNSYNAAKAIYDRAAQPADAAQVAVAQQILDAARAGLDRAEKPASELDVAQAKAQLDLALAQRDALQPSPAQLASAKAQLTQAQALLQSATLALSQLTVHAPTGGTISKLTVSTGERVSTGALLLVITDLERLLVETKDLSERDIARVGIGQSVSVMIKALGQEVPGTVVLIAPQAETLGGDVVYRTTIALNSPQTGLRPGMSVDVRF